MPKNPLFYRDWDDTASEALLSLDDEVSEMITSISEFDLSEIESLRAHYEGNTPAEITKTITGIKSLATIGSPVVSKGDKYVFDYNSRYFTADIPFGLFVYKGIAKIFGVKTPKIDEICALFESKLDYSENGAPQQYGITTRADFVALYTHFLDPWAKR